MVPSDLCALESSSCLDDSSLYDLFIATMIRFVGHVYDECRLGRETCHAHGCEPASRAGALVDLASCRPFSMGRFGFSDKASGKANRPGIAFGLGSAVQCPSRACDVGRFGSRTPATTVAAGVVLKRPSSQSSPVALGSTKRRPQPARKAKTASSAPASSVSKPKSFYVVTVPAKLKDILDSWGPKLVAAVKACCVGMSECAGSALLTAANLRVGTDCSGAEAPIWALRAMSIPHQHKFSCDWKKHVRDFIASASPPDGPIFENMLTRKLEDIPEFDLYVCGFPCTPFSLLRRHKSRLLQEQAAKPFRKLLELLDKRAPPLAVLENVLGILKVMKQVCDMLRRLGRYFVIVVKIDSKDLGEAVARPRYYFILVRKDLAISQDASRLSSLGKAIMHACKKPVSGTMVDLMLPADPTRSSSTIVNVEGVGKSKKASTATVTSKWRSKHVAYRRKMGLGSSTSHSAGDALGLTSLRQRDALQCLVDANPGKSIIADVSQNVDRSRVATNGVCPTITPRCVMCVMALKKIVSPMETLSLHLFPVHKMNIPMSVKPAALQSLGGNTMHLKSIGLAMCMALAMVKLAPDRNTGVGQLGSVSKGDAKSGSASDVISWTTARMIVRP